MADHRRQGLVVGRLATTRRDASARQAQATYTPHVDDGDNVVIINASRGCADRPQAREEGYSPSHGHIGGIKERTAQVDPRRPFPERIVEKAVERMLPRGPLARRQLGNLRVYPGPIIRMRRQQPRSARYRRMNRKNKERLMAENRQSFEGLAALKPRRRPNRAALQKLDQQGRSYATGKRKNAVARVWIKPGPARSCQSRGRSKCFRPPVLRMLIQQPW
jgi:large subunit ribosomal protein L13